jgi:FixJ family two-component response regulator
MSPDPSIVYVVDDDISIRDALQNLLRSVGLTVQTFATPQEFLASQRPETSGCLVLDIRLPGVSGMDLHRRLIESNIQIPVIFITAHGDIPMSVQAMKAGALEFLTKPFRDQDLLNAVQEAIERDAGRRQEQAAMQDLRAHSESLTSREREVMTLAVRGLLNKQIAAELGTTEATVKLHRGKVMQKMAAESFAELVRMAQTLGVPDLPPPRLKSSSDR